MLRRASALLGLSLVVTFGFAKDKTKNTLPGYVLNAHTVAVIIDPHAGFSIDDPQANHTAQKDVEAALLKWGRFDPVLQTESADLIIVVRRGSGRLADETIQDPRQNNRPGAINPNDNGAAIGGQRGGPRAISPGDEPGQPGQIGSRPQLELGDKEDSFAVFQGGSEQALNSTPAWKFVGRDGLQPGSVPAVTAFKKAIADAEKAAAKKP